MKKDEFLRKYLDNELSDSDKQKFSELMESDPQLNHELTGLVELEKNLNESRMKLRDSDIAFIGGFKADLIENLKNQPVTKFAPVNWKELFQNYALFISMLFLFFTGSIVSYFYTNQTKSSYQISYLPLSSTDEIKRNEGNNVIDEIIIEKNEKETIKKEKNIEKRSLEPLIASSEKNEIALSIKEKNILTNQQLLEKLKLDLEEFEKNQDLFNTAVTKKRLGQLYGKIAGKTEEARNYLVQATSIFEKLNYYELIAECYGELAIVELSIGNRTVAKDYIERCIQILQSNNSKKLKYWQDVFEKNFR
mgnify:CR=1 FL=1